MILVGLGGNLNSHAGSPRETCAEALALLERSGAIVLRCSPWYETAPVPVSDQPWYVNAVVTVQTAHSPEELLSLLHEIEARFRRLRSIPNRARTLDLDMLAYGDLVRNQADAPPILPHPRLQDRAFVLRPLCDLAPDWAHPVLGLTATELLERLPPGQMVRRLPPVAAGRPARGP